MSSMTSSFTKAHNEYSRLASKSTSLLLDDLWRKKRIPEDGWSDHAVELFLSWIASHDSNNRIDMIPLGAGEREGRVASSIVRRLHCQLSHGIGRSGNLCEIQPKALGSSMLNCLANEFALHALHLLGMECAKGAVVVPLCTGMSLTLLFSYWRRKRPRARFIVWPRVDQKSCFKSILAAGFEPIVVEPIRQGDALVTNVERIHNILDVRMDEVLCVLSTTSVFAPRAPDDIEAIGGLCASFGVPHIVNNAYGLQSAECIKRINETRTSNGRIDAIVQSLDKNFQVPVGGALVAFCKQSHAQSFAQFYPGRASCVPSRDLVITLLSQGVSGLVNTYNLQKQLFEKMKKKLHALAEEIGENVFEVNDNLISLAMSLSSIPVAKQTLFGAVLFSRGITGARVISSTTKSFVVEGYEFMNFNSHSNEQHVGYMTIACGVGMTESEVDELFSRIVSSYARFCRKNLGRDVRIGSEGNGIVEEDSDDLQLSDPN